MAITAKVIERCCVCSPNNGPAKVSHVSAMRALPLVLLAHAAAAFEVLSGDCRLVDRRVFPSAATNRMRTVCVKQPKARDAAGSCRIRAPNLPLYVTSFEVGDGAHLVVNGLNYTSSSGPDGVVPTSTIEWVNTGASGEFELCRPLVPKWTYLVFLIAYVCLCFAACWAFWITGPVAFIVWLFGIMLGVLLLLTNLVMPQFDGYLVEDASIIGARSASTAGPFYLDAAFACWVSVHVWQCIFIPIGIGMFLRTRMRADRRTIAMEKELRECLEDGCILLLRVSWLLKQPADFTLKRRQELPVEAFLTPLEAVKALGTGRVAVLSYRWLTGAHPDPEGFHVRAVVGFLRRGLSYAEYLSVFWYGGEHRRPTALFWDFASLHQKNGGVRDGDEDHVQFRRALSVMTYLYASPHTFVVQHKGLTFQAAWHATRNPDGQPDYDRSGWCTMEQAAASLATEGGGSLYELGHGWRRIAESERRAPKQMADIFRDETQVKFNGSGDREEVGKMYQTLHEHVVKIDEQRKRCCVAFADRVIKKMGVRCAVAFWWVAFVLLFFTAVVCTVNPAPSFVAALCWISCLVASFFLASRQFRRWHLQRLQGLCGRRRESFAPADGAPVAPAAAPHANSGDRSVHDHERHDA